ncbi:DUF2905 domain-containing protein [Acidihalobacter ferrooxydans]|uniref:DUF2905 domain-containing protein n=1 Tax=Acidihalobacter ferrooxydans TaxID=1765967 RepID=A0A1P8UD40_9GAMM|nr:DUF2905 domain-containing protein [Acidihalobacter ferrooxydans]APZ41750.1 hypothetical protein BW247_00420 [Acidihalobacter ferrooxydans]
MTRTLILLGLLLIVAGLAWPLISRLGFGRLPGDFLVRREGFTFYFPLTTSVIVSIIISVLVWLFRK